MSKIVTVLVPSLGILLFNSENQHLYNDFTEFSSPLWGFFYLMCKLFRIVTITGEMFSSPLWGFFYLINGKKD